MTLADRIVSTLSANPAPFWVLRRLHDNGGAVREALRDLTEAGTVHRDDTTELYHLVSESPETPAVDTEHVEAAGMGGSLWTTPAVPGAGGLPASKIPGLEDEIRVLTLDDVAMPLVDAASAAAIVEAIEERSTAELPPPPPRGHPAHGVGPSWSERVAALEEALDGLRRHVAALETVDLHEIARRVARLEHPEPIGPVAAPIGDHVEAKREREAIAAYLRATGLPYAATEIEDGRHLEGT